MSSARNHFLIMRRKMGSNHAGRREPASQVGRGLVPPVPRMPEVLDRLLDRQPPGVPRSLPILQVVPVPLVLLLDLSSSPKWLPKN